MFLGLACLQDTSHTVTNHTKRFMNCAATLRARELMPILMALISASMPSMKSMMKLMIFSRS